jgi:phospholipase C
MCANSRVRRHKWWLTTALYTCLLAVSACGLGASAIAASDGNPADSIETASPIKHVIILIGENRGLDHTFGIYKPKGKGQTISNILSKGIVNIDGTPGPRFSLAQQYSVAVQTSWYFGAPNTSKFPYNPTNLMPQANTNGAPSAPNLTSAPFTSVAVVRSTGETDINSGDFELLTTGATGLPSGVLDTRIPGAGTLPPGPFPLQGPNITDDDYTGDMTHRFFQAAQQQDCSLANATKANPTGCLNDLFAFVMATYSATNKSEGNEMGFYNAEQGSGGLA